MARLFDHKAQSEVRETSAFLEEVLQAMTHYAVIATALDGTVQLWNEGARLLYGYEPEEMIGKANIASFQTKADSESDDLAEKIEPGPSRWQVGGPAVARSQRW